MISGKFIFENNKENSYTYYRQLRGDNTVQIAICDDEPVYRNELKAILKACEVLDDKVNIRGFSSGESFLEENEKEPSDIVFLDIEMGEMTGLETGQKLRSIDKKVIIIFLTSHKKYVFTSFRIAPFDYILKPIDNTIISDVISRAVDKYNEQYHMVNFKWHDESYALKACEIVHIESDLRHVTFVTENNRYKSVGKLADYEKRLSPYGFLRCHKSYLINMSYIKKIGSKSILTTLGEEVDMGSRRKQYCLSTFNEFITKYRM